MKTLLKSEKIRKQNRPKWSKEQFRRAEQHRQKLINQAHGWMGLGRMES